MRNILLHFVAAILGLLSPFHLVAQRPVWAVTGLPTQKSLRFWVPESVSLNMEKAIPTGILSSASGKPTVISSPGKPLTVSGKRSDDRAVLVAYLFEFNNLDPGTTYRFTIDGSDLQPIEARTLPENLSSVPAFQVSFGSCYYHHSQGRSTLPHAYPPGLCACPDSAPSMTSAPDIRFLLGDQIYADIRSDGNRVKELTDAQGEIFHYPHYRAQWSDPDFFRFLAATPTATLADDHELWNGFPGVDKLSPWTTSRQNRDAADEAAKELFHAYQEVLNARTDTMRHSFSFSIPPLNFFVLDSWLFKKVDKDSSFIEDSARAAFFTWLDTISGPGILVASSPLAVIRPQWPISWLKEHWDPNSTYEKDIDSLWRKLAECDHDVVILGGDIHYGRFGRVDMRPWRRLLPASDGDHTSGARRRPRDSGYVYECISSPLAGLTFPSFFGSGREPQYAVNPRLHGRGVHGPIDARLAGSDGARLEYRLLMEDELTQLDDMTAPQSGMYAVLDFQQSGQIVKMRIRYYPNHREPGKPLEALYCSEWYDLF